MKKNVTAAEVAEAFKKNQELFLEAGIQPEDVAPEELVEYFSGETPTGDTTTLDDIIAHQWLLLHEIAELKHLKIKGHRITRDLVWNAYDDVLEAHFAATALELKMALKHNDTEWIAIRVERVLTWLEDQNMPERFRKSCRTLIRHYGTSL
jgi:hypothetical protein